MKKLSDFKENKIELKNINGGNFIPNLSFSAINEYPGGTSTPGNYMSSFGVDVNGDYVFVDLEPGKFDAAPR